jgi:hypothetical protein
MITHPETLEQISERMDELEKRVAHLEQRSPPQVDEALCSPVPALASKATDGESSQLGPALTVLGKALLGIAGAYVLRALSGSGVVPRALLAALAIAYAIAWLAAAARSVARMRFAGILYAATSVLVVAPMLWEMCLRFQAMSASVAAAVLAVYLAAILLLAHQPGRAPVLSVAWAGSALTALALCIATHDMAPFAAILLAMVLLGQIAKARRQPFTLSPLVLLTADVTVWALLFIYRAPAETRPEYPALGPLAVLAAAFLLFLIQAAGVAVHTCMRAQKITLFDAVQAMIALSLVACAISWFAPRFNQPLLGLLCLALAGACYAAAFGPFRRAVEPRNFRIFAAWSAGLLLLGIFLALPVAWASVVLGLLAVAAVLAGVRMGCAALELHGVLYLMVAAFSSGLLGYAAHALVGQMPAVPRGEILAVSALAVIGYAVCHEQPEERMRSQLLHFVPALLAAGAASALLMQALVRLVSLVLTPDVFHVAFLRTLTLCALAFVLVLGGSRLRRVQMTRVAYTLLVFVAAKLVFEDLRHGRLGFVAASICLVALTFIAVPRLAVRR